MTGKKRTVVLFISIFFIFFSISGAVANQIHRVETRETVDQIAADYGINVDTLLKLNRFMEESKRVFVGQALVVPEVEEAPAGPPNRVNEQQPVDNRPTAENEEANNRTETLDYKLKNKGTKTYPYVQAQPRPAETQPGYYRPGFLHSGPPGEKRIALTFDDGPDARYTPIILDILRGHGVPATFFLIGSQIEQHSDVVKRIQAEGHTIGSHSWSHPNFTKLEREDVLREIYYTERAIYKLTGKYPALFRAPGGDLTDDNVKMLNVLGYKNIFWSVDSLDWKLKDPDQVVVNVLSATHSGSIILMHSAGGKFNNLDATAASLPDLIYTLRAQGYEFVTVDELLSIPACR